ncbi:MAG: SAM-dependent methyltransferase [Salinivirgaceae bacterium]|nr:SAM-dependent methyltransferase [Salinivirgaceae bacterium]
MKPQILDACCGGKMFYFDKNDPRVLFQDIREVETTLCDGRKFVVKPDVVGNFRSMTFDDESFSLVIFDPPHLINNVNSTGWQAVKYGSITSDWRNELREGFSECFRVLRTGGFLIFKWSDIDIPVSRILELTDQKPILGHRCGKQNKTHWILFQK